MGSPSNVWVLRTVDEARAYAERVHRAGQRLALVPTMGFLHEGHLSLMREGARRADQVAVSIFVNPAQFGPREDLARYPRDEAGDLAKCESAQVTAVFIPPVEEIYPAGYQTYVEVREVAQGLCGERRPGHFRGVATVVTKLFCIFRPEVALFGEKDYQQVQVVRALSGDLCLDVKVIGLPIIREPDGLAMSSRNAYLNQEERHRALALYRGLERARRMAGEGIRNAAKLIEEVRRELRAEQVREDYVELVQPTSLKALPQLLPGQPARLLVAAFVGTTRLIDNVSLEA